MFINSWVTPLLLVWVVAVIAVIAAAIYAWQKTTDKKSRTLWCLSASLVYAVPGLLFLLLL